MTLCSEHARPSEPFDNLLQKVMVFSRNGKRAPTTDLAVKIESSIGLPARILLSAQAHYELEAASGESKKTDSRHETVSLTIPAKDHNLLQEIVKRFGWACMF